MGRVRVQKGAKWWFASFHQLYLLLWRNTLIRWRGGAVHFKKVTIPVFHLVEVLWPLFLYLIIAILRKQFPPEQVEDSKYRAYALPSAGTLPFLQSLVCDIGTGRDKNRAFSDMPTFPNATVNEVYGVLDEIGTLNASWTQVCGTVHDLAAQVDCLSVAQDCSSDRDSVPLTCYLKNPTEFRSFLSHNLSLSQRTVDGILGATLNLSQVPYWLQSGGRFRRQADIGTLLAGLQGFGVNSSSLKPLLCASDQLYGVIHFANISALEVQREVCGLPDSKWQALNRELEEQLVPECNPVEAARSVSEVLALQQILQSENILNSFEGFSEADFGDGVNCQESDEDDCQNNIFEYFCGTLKPSRFFAGLLKYGDSGSSGNETSNLTSTVESNSTVSLKILYTPFTNLTRNIIQKANRTIDTVGQVIALADEVANCSQFFLDKFPSNSSYINGTVMLLKSLIGRRENGSEPIIPFPSLPNVTLDQLQQAQNLLNDSAPNNIWSIMTTVHSVSKGISDSLRKFDWNIFLPMEDEAAMEDLAADYKQQDDLGITLVVAGVVFDPNLTSSDTLININIRSNFSTTMDTSQIKRTVWRPGPESGRDKRRYIEGFFIFVQDMIERATLEEMVGHRVASPGVYIQEMPYPCYKDDRFTSSLLYVLPLAMLFAWLFPVAMTTRAIVREKETRLKEFMKMMGVGEGLLRLSWFLHSLLVFFLSVVGITMILKLGGILPATNSLILLLYLTLYAVVMLSYSFLVSIFFNNANLAACVASLIYFLVFFAHVTLVFKINSVSPFVLGLCCLWAPLAFALGATFLTEWELQQKGLQWSNISIPPIQEDHISILTIALIMVLDAFLYFLITWYIEGVFPGRYGVAKPWYFPFLPSYWCGQRDSSVRRVFGRGRTSHVTLEEEGEEMTSLTGDDQEENWRENCEEEPEGLPLGISIQRLSKHFTSGLVPGRRKVVTAVNDLTLKFYEGQITAFLGHNGAGKTTTMSVLTGLFEASSGTAYIYGNNIRRHMDIIRQNLGICPQHNILFENLTVKEHLLFYGQLKGLSRREAKEQMPMWLEKVNLSSHADKFSQHLSGGMKRKLSILLAFVGKCKTIILDEPTSGVDPFARRQIWDFLLRHRKGRTIMLSTHHMDEAELLGDRIAIISKGSLLCCGSFEYLKHRFGRGHRLTLLKSTRSERHPSTSSRTITITADIEDVDQPLPASSSVQPESSLPEEGETELSTFLQGVVAGATLVERRGRELHYLLPLLQARPQTLAHLFGQLEEKKDSLGITSYGLTACSMEEIFVKLTERELMEGTEANESDASAPRPSLQSMDSQTSLGQAVAAGTSTGEVSADDQEESVFDEEGLLFGDETCDDPLGSGLSDTNTRLSFFKLWLLQFYALLVNRVYYIKGNLVALVIQNVLPLVVICLSLLIARYLETVPDPPRLELSPNLFFAETKFNYLFAGGYYTNETGPLIDSLFQPCGVSAHILEPSTNTTSKCYENSNSHHQCPKTNYPQTQYSCTCVSGDDETDACPLEPSYHSDGNMSQLLSDYIPPCYNGTVSGSRVQDLTRSHDPSGNDSDWAYYYLHHYLLRSTSSFVEQRYGGLSFGHSKDEVHPKVDQLNSDPHTTLPFLATHSAAKVWYSLKGYHALPAYLNTMNNAILRTNLINRNTQPDETEYGIRTFSHPFKTTDAEKVITALSHAAFLVNPLAAIFSLGFVVAGFVLLLIYERSGNIKHLQLVCGMRKTLYWLCAYFWDLIWYFVICILVMVLFLAFKDPYFTGSEELPLFFLVLVLYGLAATPWMYMWSFLFSSPATAYVFLSCLNFFSGFAFLIVDFILVQLQMTNDDDNQDNGFIHYLLVWVPFPAYQLGRSMMYLSLDRPLIKALADVVSSYNKGQRTIPIPDPYSDLYPFMLSLVIQSVIWSIVIFFIETSSLITSIIIRNKDLPLPDPNCEDPVVANERRRVCREDSKQDLLVLRNLSKVYGTRCSYQYRLAVNQLCLRMQKAECFGLLGVNGAGKTTTFRMLTGDTHVTSGEACIASHSVSGGGRFQDSVGYCPQVDALMDHMTGRQHLTFYSRLRGLPPAQVRKVVEWALIKLGLEEYADKPAGKYSGGNRRKLSTAIALLARPALILLDEPTSGVDPRARRFLWRIVRGVVGAGQSVLLTTHSMAECEALCSRVGIMVNGSFRCLGTPQQLKSAYGEGYSLKIRATGQIEALKEFIRQNLSHASLKEEHCNTLVYQLPGAGLKLSTTYAIMESAREKLDIKDYSLSQTTLDDVFIHFANQQSEDAGLLLLPRARSTPSSPPRDSSLQLPDIVAGIEESTGTQT